MLRSTILAIALVASGAAFAAEPSACKGMEETSCSSKAACVWRPMITKGQKNAAGKEYKVSRKAHCAARPIRKAKS